VRVARHEPFFFQAEDGIRDRNVTGVQTCTLPISVGVVGQIIPWNYPLPMAGWKLGAALAAGCKIVIKPASETPLSLLYAAKLFKDAGFTDGVVNVVHGSGSVAGNALVTHKQVDKVAFTGSTKTGSSIMKNAAEDIKSTTLELGGKSPAVVLEDADLDTALDGIFDGTMYNSGQNCSATTRIFVQRKIYENVLKALKEKAEKAVVGPGLDNATEYGPLVSEKQLNTVLGYIKKGKEEGARLLVGGSRKGDKGYFVEPTIFAD